MVDNDMQSLNALQFFYLKINISIVEFSEQTRGAGRKAFPLSE
jgi:hypothetical protein